MRYLLLIYNNETAPPDNYEDVFQRYMAFTEEVQNDGVYQAGDALQPTATATSVRVRKGQTQTTDGPFAETKEQLGGYYLLDCPDLDAALKYAAKIPAAEFGTIEVRPIMEFE
jgi:hypothetical protein